MDFLGVEYIGCYHDCREKDSTQHLVLTFTEDRGPRLCMESSSLLGIYGMLSIEI